MAVLPAFASSSSAAFAPAVQDEQDPSVAYDPAHSTFLVVAAADDGRVYGSRVTATGKVVATPIPISPGSEVATLPVVVWDGTAFLVAWQAEVAGCGRDIRAARLNARGSMLQSDVAISPCAGDQSAPTAATDGSSSLIAWSDAGGGISDRTFSAATGVGAAHNLSLTGTDPALSWNGIRYLVAWNSGGDINAQLLLPDGDTESAFVVASGPNAQAEPAAASNGQDFLVTWTVLGGTYDVFGMRIDADGALLGPAIPISTGVRDQGASAVAFDGTNYLVTWNDSRNDVTGATYDIVGARVSPVDGSVIDASGVPVSATTAQQLRPAVASGGIQSLAVWQDNRNGQYDVYAARVTSGAAVLDPSGFPVFAAPAATQATITLALDKTSVQANGRDSATLSIDASTNGGPLANATVKLTAVWATPKQYGAMKFLPSSTVVLDPSGHATATVISLRSGAASIVATVKTTPYAGTEFIELQARRHSVVVFASGAGSSLSCTPAPCTPTDPLPPFTSIRDDLGFVDADMPNFSYTGGTIDARTHEWVPNPSTCTDSAQGYDKSILRMRSMLRMIAGANANTDFSLVGLSQGGLLVFQMLGAQTTPLPKGSRLAHVITLDAPLGGGPTTLLSDFVSSPSSVQLINEPIQCWWNGGSSRAAVTLNTLWNTTAPTLDYSLQGDQATVLCKVVGVSDCASLQTNQQLVAARPDVDVETLGSESDSVFWPHVCRGGVWTDARYSQVVSTPLVHVTPVPDSSDPDCTISSHVGIVDYLSADIAAAIGPQQ